MSQSLDAADVVRTLQYFALSRADKLAYGLPLDFSVTFHLRDADASFRSFSDFMLSLAESEIGKIVAFIEMGNPLAPALNHEQFIALNELWKLLDDSSAYHVSEEATADLNSGWWCHASGLARKALKILNRPVQTPEMGARALLDKWSMGEYSEEFPR
jgi:hypothetical protein